MAKIRIDMERCKGCGLCVIACKEELINVGDKINSHGYHCAQIMNEEECIGCANCAEMCPDIAIEVWR